MIILFVVFLTIFILTLYLTGENRSELIQKYINGQVDAEVYYIEQGAWGSYSELVISDLSESSEETISIRAEDCKPVLDSIVGKDVYISYTDFHSKNTNLQLQQVLLGDALLRQDSLKYTYHFTNHKSLNNEPDL